MKIVDGVAALELTREFMGQKGTIYPTLIWDKDSVVLVDTGFPGQLQSIREAMEKEAIPLERLEKIIITHQDIDHIGSLPDLVQELGGTVKVLAHQEEKPYIQGEKPLVKMKQFGKFAESLPEEQRRRITALFANPPKANVDTTVSDGEILPYVGGITVVFTPGHSPGHICLYLNQSKTLVTGDALTVSEGLLYGPNPQATANLETALESLKKLTKYDIQTVISYHGGVFQDNPNQRIFEIANGELAFK
ncbi:MAG TPA: MBL fold metallo-hydrolase [Bacillota bacterium]|nr:MBL fold metallo-hydrolase [Bacillota bacterium]